MKKRNENPIVSQILAGVWQHTDEHILVNSFMRVHLCGFPNQFPDFTRAARSIDIYGMLAMRTSISLMLPETFY
jgi:hypothetical protein